MWSNCSDTTAVSLEYSEQSYRYTSNVSIHRYIRDSIHALVLLAINSDRCIYHVHAHQINLESLPRCNVFERSFVIKIGFGVLADT